MPENFYSDWPDINVSFVYYLFIKNSDMRVRSFLLFSVLAIFSSCNKYKNVQEPEYRDIRNIHLINLGPLQSTAGVDLVYYNPNNFGVQLAEARGDIYIDNNYFGQFELNDKI